MKNAKNNGKIASGIFIFFGAGFLIAACCLAFTMMSKGASLALNITTMVFVIMGGVYLAVGLIIFRTVSNDLAPRLKETGEPITATVTELCLEKKIKVNNQNPYYIVCSANVNGEERFFESRAFFQQPPEGMVGSQVVVYLDAEKPKRYYVDLSMCFPSEEV